MKLRGKYFWVPWVLFVTLGLLLAFILVAISPVIFASGLNRDFVQIIDVLIGIFIVGSIGLMVVEKSRYIGLLLIALSLPLTVYFCLTNRILYDSFAIGLAIGIAVTAYLIFKTKFDWLAKTLKYFIDAFLAIFIAYLIFVIWDNYSNARQFSLVYFIIAILLSIGLYILLSKNLYAVTSSDVLIIGPTGSGKSYFIASMAVHLVRNYHAFARSYIFSQNTDADERLKVDSIAAKYQQGIKLDATAMGEMAYYQFPSKKWGLIDLNITCLDYAGGHFARGNFGQINSDNYKDKVQLISQLMGRTPAEVRSGFGDITFFRNFYQQFRDEFYDHFDDIVPAFIYARLLKAGKIIFLIDGEKIHMRGDADEDWNAYLVSISRLVETLGEDKDYAFAITKADLIPEIKEKIRGTNGIKGIHEHSKQADDIEKEKIQSLFEDNIHLNTIYNIIMANSFIRIRYIEGFLVSVDGSMRDTDDVTGYHPWRLDQIAKYIFKF